MKSFILLSIIFLTHGGRTDSSGGHNDRINGGYHFHHGYPAHSHFDGCPYLDDDGSFFSVLLIDIGIIFFGVFFFWVWTNLYDYYLNRKIEKKNILDSITFVESKESKLVFIGLTSISTILFIFLINNIIFLDFGFDNEVLIGMFFLSIMCYFFPKWLDK